MNERIAIAVAVLGIPALCWGWVIAMGIDMYGSMSGASAWMMSFDWDARRLALLWAMWAAMMAGMMLPSAAPLLLLYGRAARARGGHQSQRLQVLPIYSLAAGYLVVWGGFSVGATVLQRILATRFLITPMMEPAVPAVSAAVLAVAGVYQLTPLKQICLTTCRSPLSFLMQHWRTGFGGAFRMGAHHGAYCVGCCWALMLILFAGGVMNLAVIAGLTAWVIIEKVAPFGQWSARIAGAVLLTAAAWLLFQAATAAALFQSNV
jgi:predicted metal-binding membrane protein